MTEQNLIDLGFKRVDVTKEQSGAPFDWHYYTYDFVKGFSLISQASDEVTDGKWFVEILETDGEIRFTNAKELLHLIRIIEHNKYDRARNE